MFDLDDTVLDRGALRLEAYGALFALRAAGLRLVACTGRPSGWGEVVARQWPVDAVVVENGALAWLRDASGDAVAVRSTDVLDPEARAARRRPLLDLARAMLARHPEAALADDNGARVTDVTIDVGEHRRVPADVVREMRGEARAAGVVTHLSSVHLHLADAPDDKASAAVRLLASRFGEDPTRARRRYAFVGDSGNDAQAFAAFRTTFGVANVRAHLAALTVRPAYVAERPMGLGFVEIAEAIVQARAKP
ncbi:MAG TPA: HAD hydrolase family protein [Minicystis sp.]|nr:HAD hydrolase family protein [Minicystis sp.]